MRYFLLVLCSFWFGIFGFSQVENPSDSLANEKSRLRDSLLSRVPSRSLTPDFYKARYQEKDLMYKVTDNRGDGFDSLYGTRNLRPILHGVAYRGGANNYYHKESKRHNHNPLPMDGIRNLCQEGFSASFYLYREGFDKAPPADTCGCVSGGWNSMQYYQFDYFDEKHIYEMLKMIHNAAIHDTVGPIYLHCWNGWHASGLLSALALRQFCGFDKWQAINYWDLGTDGANNSPRYQRIREMIKNFEPYPDLIITDELGNRICPPMPENIDPNELYVDIEQLVYVPESMPVGFDIVLHNVSFGAGQTSFPNPEKNVDIQNLLLALKQQPDLKVEIGGYTDNSGSTAQNITLSSNRAKFIHDYLVKQGVESDRISYKGYGPEKPLYSNKYPSTREGNRRIEVKIVDKKKEDYSVLVEESIGNDKFKTGIQRYFLEDLISPAGGVGLNMPVILKSVVFEPNMVDIIPEAMLELDRMVEWLNKNRSIHLQIAGHTDKSGLEELNVTLSQQRAESVMNYLIEKGVSASRLSAVGLGSAQPIASNKYQHGKEENRRIEVQITKL
jgi:outer membrane protein OmpA-like peptidoglycan-associated protein